MSLDITTIDELAENDRSSTGFLPPDEFEQVVNEFFSNPSVSVRGWERAIDAQSRIVRAVTGISKTKGPAGPAAIISHGAVGTLLYCHLAGVNIGRRWDQPPNSGGNYFPFSLNPQAVYSWWKPIDSQ